MLSGIPFASILEEIALGQETCIFYMATLSSCVFLFFMQEACVCHFFNVIRKQCNNVILDTK